MKNIFVKIICTAVAVTLVTATLLCFTSCEDNGDGGNTEAQTASPDGSVATYGNQVGNLCFTAELETFDGGSISIEDTRGKVTVINFWGEWCPWCLYELPDFNKVASEYADSVSIIAIHSLSGIEDGLKYAADNYAGTKMIFAKDALRDAYTYYDVLGGTGNYPRTIILDRDGVIVFSHYGAMSYDALVGVIKEYI